MAVDILIKKSNYRIDMIISKTDLSVATCMGVSCSQLQSVAAIWQCQIFPATIRRVASRRSVYAGELQVQEPMKTCFTSFIFSPMRACRSVALQVVAACMCSSFRYLRRRVAVSCYVYAGLNLFRYLHFKATSSTEYMCHNNFIFCSRISMKMKANVFLISFAIFFDTYHWSNRYKNLMKTSVNGKIRIVMFIKKTNLSLLCWLVCLYNVPSLSSIIKRNHLTKNGTLRLIMHMRCDVMAGKGTTAQNFINLNVKKLVDIDEIILMPRNIHVYTQRHRHTQTHAHTCMYMYVYISFATVLK